MQSPHVPGSGIQALKSPDGWMEFAAHPAILDIVEQLIGPDIILRGTAAFYKRPQKGPATAWHRDAQLQPISPLRSTHVWITVTDSRIDNACLRFIPQSHLAQEPGHHTFGHLNADGTVGPQLDPGEYDESKAIDLELEPGQMIVHDIFTVHSSRPNTGTRERASFALRYMPATSRYDHKATPAELSTNGYGHHTRPLMLVRGVDRAGNDFRLGHPQ
jgi:ectoine hydroxylase-related dioxygenase (phytanoyl-CoA dioxygenase family)